MNSMVYNPAETEPDIRCMTTETASEDRYSTTPLMMRSIYRQPNEEELHSSFEEAISDRVCALNKQLKYLNVPMIEDVAAHSSMPAIVKLASNPTRFTLLKPGARQVMLRIAIAFMLIMVGFDLMGLLVLLRLP